MMNYLQLWNTMLYFMLAGITALGNFVVVLAVWKDPHKQLRQHLSSYLITSLAISNLVLVPGEIMQGISNIVSGMRAYEEPCTELELWANILGYFAICTSLSTVFTLAIERYALLKYAAIAGVRRLKRTHIVLAIAGVWVPSLAMALSRLAFKTDHPYRNFMGFCGVAMLVSIMYLYLAIYITVRRVYRVDLSGACSMDGEDVALTASGLAAQRIQKRQLHASKTILTIVAALVILWLPSIIAESIKSFSTIYLAPELKELMYIVGLFNAAIDPLIYAYRMTAIRNAVATILWREKKVNKRRVLHKKPHGQKMRYYEFYLVK